MTLGNPSLPDYILASVIMNILKGDKTEEVVRSVAATIEKYSDERFKSKSEGLQQQIVESILLPLCKELMSEDIITYKRILFEAWKKIPISK